MAQDPPEIEEAASRVTRPLPYGRGWIVRERVDGRWVDHPQVVWHEAQTFVRRLRAETAVRLALEARGMEDDGIVARTGAGAALYRNDWRRHARKAIRSLPETET